jgi:hypothetical protein
MNWKVLGRKQAWPYFKVLSQYLPGETEKITKNSVRIPGIRTGILTLDLPNTKQKS